MADEWDKYKSKPTADEAFGPEPKPDEWDKYKVSSPEPKPGLVSDIKSGLGGAVKVGQDVASSLAGVPDWAVEMQERRTGKPYKGLLTTPLPFIGKSVRDLSKSASEAIQTPLVGKRAQQAAETVEAPLRALDKVAKAGGDIAQTVTGSPSAGTLVEAGVNLLPSFLGTKGGKEIAKRGIEKGSEAVKAIPEYIYKGAVKPQKKLSLTEQKALVDKGLDTRTLAREGTAGLDKLRRMIDDSTRKIDSIIDRSSKRGDTVKTHSIIKDLEKIRDAYPEWRGDASFEAMVDSIKAKGDQMPIAEAQKLKRKLNHAYDHTSSSLLNEGERALRHSILDQEIALHPELKNLGQGEKAMIDLQKAIGDRVKTYGKREILTVGSLIKAGLGMGAYGEFGHPGAMIAGTLAILAIDHPTVKSALAIALNDARKVGVRGAKGAIGVIPPIPVIPGGLPQPGKQQE